jgi:hypothetical protein
VFCASVVPRFVVSFNERTVSAPLITCKRHRGEAHGEALKILCSGGGSEITRQAIFIGDAIQRMLDFLGHPPCKFNVG